MLCIDFAEYSIESGNDGHVFAVNITTGSVYVVGELSYQKKKVDWIAHLIVQGILDDQVLTEVEFKCQLNSDKKLAVVFIEKVNVIKC